MRWHRQPAVTLLAAALFLLQSFFASWTAAYAGPTLDAFGNPLCLSAGTHGDSAPASDHSKMPNCCTLGCGQFAAVAGHDHEPSWLANPRIAQPYRHAAQALIHAPEPDHNPGSPRAPPALI